VPSKRIRELSNIGPKTATWLEAVGVIEVYKRLKVLYPEKVSLNALWALQGVILDIPWNQLPESMKEDLKQRLRKEGE
jgi:DNA transformation protein and related proteins